MIQNKSPQDAVKEILKRAYAFYRRHGQDSAVRKSYGHFTHHPIATLNGKRLRHLLDATHAASQELKRPLRVLDLACGGGLITSAIASMGHRVLGLDLDREQIRVAQLFASEEKLDGMFLQADLLTDATWEKSAEDILGGKPDAVVLSGALHHFSENEAFLNRLSRWLPPGARLIIGEENPESPFFRIRRRLRGWLSHPAANPCHHRTFEDWKQALERAGFHVSEPPSGDDWFPGLARVAPKQAWSLVFTARRG